MTKLPALTQAEFCSTLVDEWARAGVRAAVLSPGSRSAPMALALVGDARIDVKVRLDERSASYVALGMSLASGTPCVVLTTSGTAAAEAHAAVIEADRSRVPLIVCTADRPPELQHVGAPQTIEQRGLYGDSVRWSLDAGVADEQGRRSWRSLGSRIVAEALSGPGGPGPVHVNLAFREPLVPPAGSVLDLPQGRENGRPWHDVARSCRVPSDRQLQQLAPLLSSGRRGVIVAGAGCGEPAAVLGAAAALGWPLLADPRSGCRLADPGSAGAGNAGAGAAAGTAGAVIVAAADALLRDDSFRAAHRPEVVLRLGQPWASKVLAGWFADTSGDGAVHVVADPDWAWRDPGREAAVNLTCDGDGLLASLAGVAAAGPTTPGDWAQSWASGEKAAQQAIDAVLEADDELTEPFIARHVSRCDGVGTIVVASSMPVRDLEWFGAVVEQPPRVLSNRGANGIEGTVSTTLGVAAAVRTAGDKGMSADGGMPAAPSVTVGLLGDLAFLHDLTAFVRPDDPEGLPPCVLVVVDNHGGGIFSFLPQALELEDDSFEQLFGTPQLPDTADVARGLGMAVMETVSRSSFEKAFARALEQVVGGTGGGGPTPVVVVARTNRRRNVQVHSELNAAVTAGLAAPAGD